MSRTMGTDEKRVETSCFKRDLNSQSQCLFDLRLCTLLGIGILIYAIGKVLEFNLLELLVNSQLWRKVQNKSFQ